MYVLESNRVCDYHQIKRFQAVQDQLSEKIKFVREGEKQRKYPKKKQKKQKDNGKELKESQADDNGTATNGMNLDEEDSTSQEPEKTV